jgi:hypothetical protein
MIPATTFHGIPVVSQTVHRSVILLNNLYETNKRFSYIQL